MDNVQQSHYFKNTPSAQTFTFNSLGTADRAAHLCITGFKHFVYTMWQEVDIAHTEPESAAVGQQARILY
jgi:hypothetical protein